MYVCAYVCNYDAMRLIGYSLCMSMQLCNAYVIMSVAIYSRKEGNGKGTCVQPRSSGSRPQQCGQGVAKQSRCRRARLTSLSARP